MSNLEVDDFILLLNQLNLQAMSDEDLTKLKANIDTRLSELSWILKGRHQIITRHPSNK